MNEHFTLPYEGGLIEENLPGGILHNYEKIWTEIYPESVPASCAVADLIVSSIKACEGRLFRLGLTTGATPVTLYAELARRYEAGEVSFRNVEVVSIDEYYPFSSDDRQSRNHRLHEDRRRARPVPRRRNTHRRRRAGRDRPRRRRRRRSDS